MSNGIVIVAYGPKAHQAASECVASIREFSELPVSIITDSLSVKGTQSIIYDDKSFGARGAKLNQDRLTDFDATLYMDADTIALQGIAQPFAILDDGFDLCITTSGNQHNHAFRHIAEKERMVTCEEVGLYPPLQFQAGVMYWKRNETMIQLFAEWRKQWQRYGRQDQAALVRAIEIVQPRVWLLGHPYNDRRGEIIQHEFGKAR